MDPVSVGLLAALAGGAGGELGRQVWAALGVLVRRPFRHPGAADGDDPVAALETGSGTGVESGQAELAALMQAPADEQCAAALSMALARRAALDAGFATALDEWRQQAVHVQSGGTVKNQVSGGTFHGPVLQGRDFTHLTFGASPATCPSPPDPGAGPGRPDAGQDINSPGPSPDGG